MVMSVRELNEIIANQKTVSTKRLAPIAKRIGILLKDQSLKINAQRNTIKELNKRHQKELRDKKSRERAMADFEHLKRKHSHLKQKHEELARAYKQLKEEKE